ncbi:MAG: biotin/lipoyl-binding protein, partial [Rikenellaceae bacterium]
MNKVTKWGIITLIAAGVGGGIYIQKSSLFDPDQMEEPPVKSTESQKKSLNVNAIIMRPQSIVDLFNTTGVLHPDEMVDLSFESSGKIVSINFEEGTLVKKGDLLATINCSQLLAEKQRLTAQLKLANDRVYRQSTLLKRDAVSQEALEQVQTA